MTRVEKHLLVNQSAIMAALALILTTMGLQNQAHHMNQASERALNFVAMEKDVGDETC